MVPVEEKNNEECYPNYKASAEGWKKIYNIPLENQIARLVAASSAMQLVLVNLHREMKAILFVKGAYWQMLLISIWKVQNNSAHGLG